MPSLGRDELFAFGSVTIAAASWPTGTNAAHVMTPVPAIRGAVAGTEKLVTSRYVSFGPRKVRLTREGEAKCFALPGAATGSRPD